MKNTYNALMAKIQNLNALAAAMLASEKETTARVIHRRRKPEMKFMDTASGQTWSGRGKTPLWMKAAMALGKTKEDFAVAVVGSMVATDAVSANDQKVIRTRRKPEAKFVDTTSGKAWSGRGKTPVWLREALNAGKSKAEFAVAA